mmetsp:Transcript_3635/g.16681  ORF Transcript_3635/g.16681 Transcript_3635/m.16681 type:complete len:206 (+) Transcript_3635:2061-2678(+)
MFPVRLLRGAVRVAVGFAQLCGRRVPVDLRAVRSRRRLRRDHFRAPIQPILIRGPNARPIARERPLLRRDAPVERAHPSIPRAHRAGHAPRNLTPLPAPVSLALNGDFRVKSRWRRRRLLPPGLSLLPPGLLRFLLWTRRGVRREPRGDSRLPPLRRQPRLLPFAIRLVEFLLPLTFVRLRRRSRLQRGGGVDPSIDLVVVKLLR